MTDDDTTLADIAELEEVTSPGPSVRGVVFALLAAAAGVAVIVVGAGIALGALAHSEAGFCGIGSTPCTSLSLESVEKYAALDLPEGTDVTSAYYLDWSSDSALRETMPAEAGFSAEVRLPAGAADPLRDSGYLPGAEVPAEAAAYWQEREADVGPITDVGYADAFDESDPAALTLRYVFTGTDADGRRVLALAATPLQ